MLELLAGPFAVVEDDGTTAIDISEAQFYPVALYDDTVGLASYLTGSLSITQLDGVTYRRAARSRAQLYVLDLTTKNDWLMIESLFLDKVYAYDRLTGAIGNLIISGSTAEMADIQARASNRYLSFTNAHAQSRPLDLSSGFSTECTLVGAGSGRANLSRTRHANIICLTWTTGQVLYYDFVNAVQAAGSATLPANYGAWYSPRHDFFVVLTGTGTNHVSVYANSVEPDSITDPVASPALVLGQGSRISVTLLGANNDPVAGELVDWSLTGPGTLLSTQSESDADGIASVGYVAPLTLTINPTFTATVTL